MIQNESHITMVTIKFGPPTGLIKACDRPVAFTDFPQAWYRLTTGLPQACHKPVKNSGLLQAYHRLTTGLPQACYRPVTSLSQNQACDRPAIGLPQACTGLWQAFIRPATGLFFYKGRHRNDIV